MLCNVTQHLDTNSALLHFVHTGFSCSLPTYNRLLQRLESGRPHPFFDGIDRLLTAPPFIAALFMRETSSNV
jgi:hypothetical protein